MAPDRVFALRAAAGLFVFTGVHRLEVIDVAVRLVEVAVAVGVVAIPDVELRQVGVDFLRRLAGGELRGVPNVDRSRRSSAQKLAHQTMRAAIVVSVASLVVRHPNPLGDLPLDGRTGPRTGSI